MITMNRATAAEDTRPTEDKAMGYGNPCSFIMDWLRRISAGPHSIYSEHKVMARKARRAVLPLAAAVVRVGIVADQS